MEDYRLARIKNQELLKKEIVDLNEINKNTKSEVNIKDVHRIITNFLPTKSPVASISFARDYTMFRTFIYSLVCGANNSSISVQQFLAGCNRFGIDNPCPIITKRLSLYGVSEDLDKEFKKLIEKYKEFEPIKDVDPEILGQAELKNAFLFEADAKRVYDFKETLSPSPAKKFSAIQNMTLLAQSPAKAPLNDVTPRVGDPKSAREEQNKQEYSIAGIKMNIVDIKHIEHGNPDTIP